MHLSEHKASIFTGIGISYSKSMVAYSVMVGAIIIVLNNKITVDNIVPIYKSTATVIWTH